MTSMHRIADRQDGTAALRLLKAVAVAHRSNQWAQTLSFGVSIALAVGGLLAGPGSWYASAVAIAGALWAAVYKVAVVPWAERHLVTAASLQEMFDVDLLGLPWNPVAAGDRIGEDEVSRLGRRFRGDESRLRGYYLVAGAAEPYDVLFCLEQNLAWGSRVRLRFAQMMIGVLVAWSMVGVLVTAFTGATVVWLIAGWFVPSLGLLLLCLDMYRTQMTSTRERLRILKLVRAVVDDTASPVITVHEALTQFARQVQDALYHMRRLQPRLPAWYFQHYHDQDKADFQVKMHDLEARFPRP